jgi:hypothetical protein
VNRRLKTLPAFAALIAVSSSAILLVDLRAGVSAMACCTKTHYHCAGLKTPDDCCKTMRHAPAHPVPSTAAGKSAEPRAMAATLLSTSQPATFSLSPSRQSADSKRPHDPPHLHTFALLI